MDDAREMFWAATRAWAEMCSWIIKILEFVGAPEDGALIFGVMLFFVPFLVGGLIADKMLRHLILPVPLSIYRAFCPPTERLRTVTACNPDGTQTVTTTYPDGKRVVNTVVNTPPPKPDIHAQAIAAGMTVAHLVVRDLFPAESEERKAELFGQVFGTALDTILNQFTPKQPPAPPLLST